MTVRVGWEDKYCIFYQNSGIDNNDDDATGVFVGADGLLAATNGILLDEHPMINPGVEHINTDKATGLAEMRSGAGYEFIVGRKIPAVSIGAMGLTEYKLAIFAWLLFQKGSTENGTTPFAKNYVVPVAGNAECEVWCSFGRSVGAGTDGKSYALHGGIATQLGISGAEGERMVLSAEIVGRNFVDTYDHTASNFTPEGVADHMFFNYTWTLGGTALTGLQSFDCTIANNAATRLYGSQVPGSFALGKFGTTGTFKLAMSNATVGDNTQLDNFIAGTIKQLIGTYTDKIVIRVNCHYTGAEIDPAEELMMSLPYEAVNDGSNDSILLTVTDSIDRGIP